HDEQRERQDHVDRLQYLDHALGRTAIEVVDVEDDALDVRRILARREKAGELLEVAVHRGDDAEVVAIVVGGGALDDEVLEALPVALPESVELDLELGLSLGQLEPLAFELGDPSSDLVLLALPLDLLGSLLGASLGLDAVDLIEGGCEQVVELRCG